MEFMIIYDLICEYQHRFEAWFDSSDDYQQQRQTQLLTCPNCNSSNLAKIPSGGKYLRHATTASQDVAAVRDVGRAFPQEARKMHYGEIEPEPIRGQASIVEAIELAQEGVPFTSLGPVAEKLH